MTWRNRSGAAAAVVISLALGWRAVLLSQSYFNQDDFYLSGRAYASDLTLDFLVRDTAGHVNPMQQLTYWLVSRTAPYDWSVVALFILAMHLGAALLMWHVLTRLLPGRWVRLPLLVVFVCSPLTLATSLWWSAAMGLWPHVLFSLWSILFLIRAHQGVGRRWINYLGCCLTLVTALLWHERAVLIVPTLFGVAVVLMDGPGWRRVTRAIRTGWPLWLSLGALLAAFLLGHAALTSVEGGGTEPSVAARISWSFVGENVVPGLLSGPWQAELRGGAVLPAVWVTVVAGAAAVSLAVLLLLRGGPSARWAVAVLIGYVLADLALVLAGRGGFGRIIGLDPRYSSDVVHAAVVAAALALRDSPWRFGLHLADDAAWRRVRTTTLLAVSLAYVVGAAFATARLVPHFQNTEDRAFVTNFRSSLAADPNQVVVDALAPHDVVLPLVGDDSRLSRILGLLPESPAFDQPSARLRVANAEGWLRRVAISGAIPMRPGPVKECGYPVRATFTEIALLTEIVTPVVVHLAYFTDKETTVEVTAGSWRTRFRANPGPNEMWVPVPTRGEQLDSVGLATDDGTTVCFSGLEAGLPVTRED